MKATIYCEASEKGVHSFYLSTAEEDYFLFSQNYRKGVHAYFSKGVRISEATDYSKTHNDSALQRTMTKIPMYIKYVEKEYDIEVLERTKKKKHSSSGYEQRCA